MAPPLMHLNILITNIKPSENPVGFTLIQQRGCELTLLSNETINKSRVYRTITGEQTSSLLKLW